MGKKKKKNVVGIAFSDLHLKKYNNYNEGNRRLLNAIDVIRVINTKSKVYGNIPILFCGDMIDNHSYVRNSVLDLISEKCTKYWNGKSQTYSITGNHDQSEDNTFENQSPSYIKTFSRLFKSFHCIDFKSVELDNLVLHGIPYLTHDIGIEKCIKQRLKERVKGKINILMLHTTLKGARDTDGREIESRIKKDLTYLFKKFDLVLTGHIHSARQLGENVFQIGAPQHQRKTDRDAQLGYWLIYKDGTMEFVELTKYPKFIGLQPGEKKPDNKNFYYELETEKDETPEDVDQGHKDYTAGDRTKVVKRYCKDIGLKDKKKVSKLIEVIKDIE